MTTKAYIIINKAHKLKAMHKQIKTRGKKLITRCKQNKSKVQAMTTKAYIIINKAHKLKAMHKQLKTGYEPIKKYINK